MAATLIVHDRRLLGSTPRNCTESLLINASWRLSTVLDWLRDASARYGYIKTLRILCHGFERHGGGGFGMEFGADNITVRNVHQWSALAGSVAEIVLHSCSVGHINAYGSFDGPGDGAYLCKRLAASSHAWVIAGVETQYYRRSLFTDVIDFGRWEGMVLEFSPRGRVRQVKR